MSWDFRAIALLGGLALTCRTPRLPRSMLAKRCASCPELSSAQLDPASIRARAFELCELKSREAGVAVGSRAGFAGALSRELCAL
jgi:hypothetical protein